MDKMLIKHRITYYETYKCLWKPSIQIFKKWLKDMSKINLITTKIWQNKQNNTYISTNVCKVYKKDIHDASKILAKNINSF